MAKSYRLWNRKQPLSLPLRGSDLQVPLGSFRDFYAFEQHVATCRRKRGLDVVPEWYEVPVFYFSNSDSLVGDEHPIPVPMGSRELDYELELGVVIGKPGRNIPREQAWEHVLGFTIINDFSARDLQRQEMKVGLGPAKGKDFATAVGPEIVPLDQLIDAIDDQGRLHLSMTASVNGQQWSAGNAGEMFHSWPHLIHRASENVTLQCGDLLGSGTVGTGCILELGPETTGGWLKSGDTVTLEIEKIGKLSNRILPCEATRQDAAPSPLN